MRDAFYGLFKGENTGKAIVKAWLNRFLDLDLDLAENKKIWLKIKVLIFLF